MSTELPDRFPDLFAKSECPACGYLLAGLPRSGKCPECGQPYDDRSSIVLYGRLKVGLGGRSWAYRAAVLAFGLICAGQILHIILYSHRLAAPMLGLWGNMLLLVILNRASGARAYVLELDANGLRSRPTGHHVLKKHPSWNFVLLAILFLTVFAPPSFPPPPWWVAAVIGGATVGLVLGHLGLRRSGIVTGSLASLLRPSGWRQRAADYRRYRATITNDVPLSWFAFCALTFERVDDQHVRVTFQHTGFWGWVRPVLPVELILQVPSGQLPALQACVAEWSRGVLAPVAAA